MGNKKSIKDWSNEKLYTELHSDRNKRFNPGLIYLVQQEINKRWIKTWTRETVKENKETTNV